VNEIHAGEMVEFASGVKGIALNLENENVGIVVFGCVILLMFFILCLMDEGRKLPKQGGLPPHLLLLQKMKGPAMNGEDAQRSKKLYGISKRCSCASVIVTAVMATKRMCVDLFVRGWARALKK
jgi:hypothetical protein